MTNGGTGAGEAGQNGFQKILSRILNFDVLIGGSLLKLLYYIGLVGIVLWSLIALIGALAMAQYSAGAFLLGLVSAVAILIVGTLFWRFTCELWMVVFKIHERLGEIRDRLPPQ